MPDTGKVRMPVRQTRSWRGQVRFAVSFSRNAFRRISQPLAGRQSRHANQDNEDIRQYVETPHFPSRSLPSPAGTFVHTTAAIMSRRQLRTLDRILPAVL